ncbi:hypothetical protein ACIRVF_08175 [Kitasatospora sp. NPDC101157]|uniref:hypothetical protein n=1 Tax=Kitasatospora sp. NPDC101157 TaxID=3364098 RepID=UPI00382F991C
MDDDLVRCNACPDRVPHRDIREHAGQPFCLDCIDNVRQRDDKALTRRLAYAA